MRHGGKKNKLKRGIKDSTKPCALFYANINEFTLKTDSLKQLIIEHNIDILIMTETKVYTKTKIRLEGYQVFPSVCKGKNGGGILVAFKPGFCSSVMIDGGESAEFITVRLDFGRTHFRLICVYTPQGNNPVAELDNFYENLSMQITRTCLAGDPVFLAGDFSAKLGRQSISGDMHDISSNGNCFSKLKNEFNLEALNGFKKCHGTFTRVNNKNYNEKSVLDYLIVSSELSKYTNSMSIDEQKQFTPWRTLKGGKHFSDYNAILLNIDSPLKGDVQKLVSKTTWNSSDQSVWVGKVHKSD